MKKKISLALCIAMLFSTLCACQNTAANDAILRVSNGAFNMTPQEYIDLVNATIKDQGDSRYKTIPDFVSSGEKIEICSYNFTLVITTNESGYITELDFDWKLGNDYVNNTAPFIVGFTIGCICPLEEGEAVWTKLDMMDYTSPKYNTLTTCRGVTFDYDCFYEGIYSELVIYPEA